MDRIETLNWRSRASRADNEILYLPSPCEAGARRKLLPVLALVACLAAAILQQPDTDVWQGSNRRDSLSSEVVAAGRSGSIALSREPGRSRSSVSSQKRRSQLLLALLRAQTDMVSVYGHQSLRISRTPHSARHLPGASGRSPPRFSTAC